MAQHVEYGGVHPVPDEMYRTIGKDGIHPVGMSRTEYVTAVTPSRITLWHRDVARWIRAKTRITNGRTGLIRIVTGHRTGVIRPMVAAIGVAGYPFIGGDHRVGGPV